MMEINLKIVLPNILLETFNKESMDALNLIEKIAESGYPLRIDTDFKSDILANIILALYDQAQDDIKIKYT